MLITYDIATRNLGTAARYRAALKADAAYAAELRRVFGEDASNARYDARGESTPELRRLSDAKLAADADMRATWGRKAIIGDTADDHDRYRRAVEQKIAAAYPGVEIDVSLADGIDRDSVELTGFTGADEAATERTVRGLAGDVFNAGA